MKTKVYSYIHFSTPEQAKGASLRLQMEQSEAYARQLYGKQTELPPPEPLLQYEGNQLFTDFRKLSSPFSSPC
jgi:hypothetical protein